MSELVLRLAGSSLRSVAPRLEWGRRSAAGARVDLRLPRPRLADVRWLWEDPSADGYDPTSGRRRRAEVAVAAVGAALGRAFVSGPATRELLKRALARPAIAVRIVADPRVQALPWEPATTPPGRFLLGRAGSLARALQDGPARPARRRRRPGPLRVLVVVSRPRGARDVGYLALAGTLLERIDGRAEVRVVRPGTVAALVDGLAGGDWDYVHFDGHGVPGGLLFEDGFVPAGALARALGRQEGRVFTLNACDSAVAAPPGGDSGSPESVAGALLGLGAAGVVAMGAAVRVSSAATFFERFYAEAAEGRALASACAAGRTALRTDTLAGVADWAVPVLYLGADAAPARPGPSELPRPAPSAAAPFTGRDGELFALDRMLDEPGAVLVHGAAGIGKTALAERLLDWRRRTGAAGRVCTFSFRGSPPLEALCLALEDEAAATRPAGARDPGGSTGRARPAAERLEALGRHFAGEAVARDFLFDGADALLAAGEGGSGAYAPPERAAFLRLLAAMRGPGCRVVLTSRRKHADLRRAGVRRFRLSGVLARDRRALLRAWAAAFGSREQAEARSRTARGRREVEDLLRTLGGHPLATRTAAYALRSLPVAGVDAALRAGKALPAPPPEGGHGPDELVAGARGAPAAAPRAWGLLGLFRGCFGEMDLSALLARPELPAALREGDPAAGARRILLHGRALGLAAPAAPPRGWEVVPGAAPALEAFWRRGLGGEEVRQVELAFVRAWEAAARSHHRPDGDVPPAVAAFARQAEGNLRRALDLADAHGEWRAAYAMVSLLATVWHTAGRRADADDLAAHWMKRAGRERGGPSPDTPARLDLWRMAAGLRARRLAAGRRFDPALRLFRRIAKTLEGPGDRHAENLAVNAFLVGEVHQERGALRAAAAAYRDALSRWEALGDRGGQSRACQALGSLEEERGRLDPAQQWYARALELDVALGDALGAAGMHLSLGRLELRRDRPGAAEAWYRAGLELLAPFPPLGQTATFYSDLGLVAMERDRLDEAEAWFRRALAIHRSQRSRANVAAVCHQLGQLEHRRGTASEWVEEERERFAAAERWYRKSARIERRRGDLPGAARSYHQLGILEQDRENPAAAERWYRKALKCARGSADPEDTGVIHAQLGRCLAEAGRPERAARHLIEGYGRLADAGSPLAGRLASDLAALCAELGPERFTGLWRERGRAPEGLEAILRPGR